MKYKRNNNVDNQYFYKEYPQQGIIILFKKWSKGNSSECEKICKDILNILVSGHTDLFVSDIISQVHWDERIKQIVEKTLYIRQGNESSIIASGIDVITNGKFEEIFDGKTQIACIYIKRARLSSLIRIIIFVVIALVCLIGLYRHCSNQEDNEVDINRECVTRGTKESSPQSPKVVHSSNSSNFIDTDSSMDDNAEISMQTNGDVPTDYFEQDQESVQLIVPNDNTNTIKMQTNTRPKTTTINSTSNNITTHTPIPNSVDVEYERYKAAGLSAYQRYYENENEKDRLLAISNFKKAVEYKYDAKLIQLINKLNNEK